MSRLRRYYGAHWFHLAAMACCFTVAGYAAVRLLTGRTLAVALWVIGGALLHDLVLVPLYSAADLAARTALPPHPGRPPEAAGTSGDGRAPAPESPVHRAPVRWINYLRVPVVLSGLLLLVWFPLILRRPAPYRPDTTLSSDVYFGRWLLITAVLFAASALAAVAAAVRRRR